MKSSVKKRNPMISIAKAIGIMLMVIGHVYDKESWGVHYIYMFHMPLFFVLSGYFLKVPQSGKDFLVFVKKKIIGLYVPFLAWTVLFILVHNFLLHFDIGAGYYSVRDMLYALVKTAVTFASTERVLVGFWFLKALFTAVVFVAAFGFAAQKMRISIYHVSAISLTLALLMLLLGISNKTIFGMLYGSFFLGFGFLFKKINLERVLPSCAWLVIMAIMVLVVSRLYSDVANTEMLYVDKVTVLPFALSGCVGSALVISVSDKIATFAKRDIVDFLRYAGDHTMIILALHYPLIKIFDHCFIRAFDGMEPLRLALGGVGILLPLAIYRVYESARVKYRNR